MKKLILLVITIALTGCATVGKPIDQNKMSQIKEGITTEQEVVAILGNPYMKTLSQFIIFSQAEWICSSRC